MQIDNETYKRWLNISKNICKQYAPHEDILNDVMINMIKYKIEDSKLTDGFIYVSILNHFKTHIYKESRLNLIHKDSPLEDIPDEELDIEDRDSYEFLLDLRLKVIEDVIPTFSPEDQKIFTLYFVHNINGREISKNTSISINNIYNRIKSIKNKILEEYEKRKTY